MKVIIRINGTSVVNFFGQQSHDALFAGSIMFFFTMFLMDGSAEVKKKVEEEVKKTVSSAYDNSTFTNDEGQSTLELSRFPARPPIYEHSRL